LAAENGHLALVQELLEAGSPLEAVDHVRRTALQCAALRGHPDVVATLLEAGSSLAARDKCDNQALHLAVENGHLEVTRILLAAHTDVHATDKFQNTPLILAAECGYLELVELLLAAGSDVDAVDHNGKTAAECACENPRANPSNRAEIVRLLKGEEKDDDEDNDDEDNDDDDVEESKSEHKYSDGVAGADAKMRCPRTWCKHVISIPPETELGSRRICDGCGKSFEVTRDALDAGDVQESESERKSSSSSSGELSDGPAGAPCVLKLETGGLVAIVAHGVVGNSLGSTLERTSLHSRSRDEYFDVDDEPACCCCEDSEEVETVIACFPIFCCMFMVCGSASCAEGSREDGDDWGGFSSISVEVNDVDVVRTTVQYPPAPPKCHWCDPYFCCVPTNDDAEISERKVPIAAIGGLSVLRVVPDSLFGDRAAFAKAEFADDDEGRRIMLLLHALDGRPIMGIKPLGRSRRQARVKAFENVVQAAISQDRVGEPVCHWRKKLVKTTRGLRNITFTYFWDCFFVGATARSPKLLLDSVDALESFFVVGGASPLKLLKQKENNNGNNNKNTNKKKKKNKKNKKNKKRKKGSSDSSSDDDDDDDDEDDGYDDDGDGDSEGGGGGRRKGFVDSEDSDYIDADIYELGAFDFGDAGADNLCESVALGGGTDGDESEAAAAGIVFSFEEVISSAAGGEYGGGGGGFDFGARL
jgi:Ankyrin repeats (3 copies)/Ankyrin repeats (many copies)